MTLERRGLRFIRNNNLKEMKNIKKRTITNIRKRWGFDLLGTTSRRDEQH